MTKADQQVESRLIPILLEGVEVIKMIFFKKLKLYISEEFPEQDYIFINRLTGAVINELFGTLNPDPSFVSFRTDNLEVIERTLQQFQETMKETQAAIDALSKSKTPPKNKCVRGIPLLNKSLKMLFGLK